MKVNASFKDQQEGSLIARSMAYSWWTSRSRSSSDHWWNHNAGGTQVAAYERVQAQRSAPDSVHVELYEMMPRRSIQDYPHLAGLHSRTGLLPESKRWSTMGFYICWSYRNRRKASYAGIWTRERGYIDEQRKLQGHRNSTIGTSPPR